MNLYFIGVTSKHSLIVKILPDWAKSIDIKLNLINIDLPLLSDASEYHKAVCQIKNDKNAIGSVVISHKLQVYKHALELFEKVDAVSNLTKEIGTIVRRDSGLTGMALPDCMSTTLSLQGMLDKDYWPSSQSDVVCFGAGGVARSIFLSLLYDFQLDQNLKHEKKYKPRKLYLVDIKEDHLSSAKQLFKSFDKECDIQYLCHTRALENDQLINLLPAGSLIINATGMGEDIPGSPLSDEVTYPAKSIIWDLNYRGERTFLKQAKAQESDCRLFIHDGWQCFIYGWTQALQLSLQTTFSQTKFNELAQIAEHYRHNESS